MLHSVKELIGFRLAARDGELGTVRDVYFDDEKWAVRHLVVATGGWLSGRKVLVSPISVSAVEWSSRDVSVNLTQQQIRDSPGTDTDKPVSRQHEADLHDYYGYPYYWAGSAMWGYAELPVLLEPERDDREDLRESREQMERQHQNPHLRSSNEVTGYHIECLDGPMGHVEDLLMDDEDWSIRLVVVDTRNWWPGKEVLIAPERIDGVSWEERKVAVNATREQIEHSPDYDSLNPPPRESLSDVYRRIARASLLP